MGTIQSTDATKCFHLIGHTMCCVLFVCLLKYFTNNTTYKEQTWRAAALWMGRLGAVAAGVEAGRWAAEPIWSWALPRTGQPGREENNTRTGYDKKGAMRVNRLTTLHT